MNTKALYEKTLPNIVVILVSVILLLWGATGHINSHYWKARYRALDEQCIANRARLDDFERREQQVKAITDSAVEYAGFADEVLERDINTIREVRAQIQDLADYCSRLEQLVFGVRNIINNKEINDEQQLSNN